MALPITTERVSFGHPDKVADQISDTVLDFFLELDSDARVACETLVSEDSVIIRGEYSSYVDIEDVMEDAKGKIAHTIQDIGYDYSSDLHQKFGMHSPIDMQMKKQSSEIYSAVHSDVIGAGDQGIVVGHYDPTTSSGLPYNMDIARGVIDRLQRNIYDSDGDRILLPDAKTQVSVDSNENLTILVSTCHTNKHDVSYIRDKVEEKIRLLDNCENAKIIVNPAGAWHYGGPASDTGLTGRKIVVDSYGPKVPVGGGAFSGKDWTKVDRSGAYMARWVAKQMALHYTLPVTVYVSYIIGQANPSDVIVMIDEKGVDKSIKSIIPDYDDMMFSPQEICNRFGLNNPIYLQTARHGHFGCVVYPWEK